MAAPARNQQADTFFETQPKRRNTAEFRAENDANSIARTSSRNVPSEILLEILSYPAIVLDPLLSCYPTRIVIQSNPLLIAAAAAAAATAAQKCCCPKQGSNVLFPSALPLASAKQLHNEVLAGGSDTAKHHALKDGTTAKNLKNDKLIARTSSWRPERPF